MLLDDSCNYFSLYGLIIKVKCKGIENEVAQFFAPFPFYNSEAAHKSVDIELEFSISDSPVITSFLTSDPISCYGLLLYREDEVVYLKDQDSIFQIDARAGKGVVTLHRSFLSKPALSKYNFLLIGLVHLLSAQGFFDLHGAGLSREGTGYLILGKSGSGKSSMTVSLINQGWEYQSDDALLLRQSKKGVEALAFRLQFYIDPFAVRHYPDIVSHLAKKDNGGVTKQFIDMHKIYPEQFSAVSVPEVLIFTNIVEQYDSTLSPVDRTSSFINLMKQSESIYLNRQASGTHMEVLKRLVEQAKSYQLHAGRDLYENPGKVSDMLANV